MCTWQVHENEPVRLEGVVRSADRTQDVISKRGTIKNLAGRFASSAQSRDSDDSSDDEDSGRRRPAPQRRPVTDDRQAGGGSDAVVLSENVPAEQDPSIVRSTDGFHGCLASIDLDGRAWTPTLESGDGYLSDIADDVRQFIRPGCPGS